MKKKSKCWTGYVSENWFNTFNWKESIVCGKDVKVIYDYSKSGFTNQKIFDVDKKVKMTMEEL